MQDNLSSSSQALRRETLTILTAFEQPTLTGKKASNADGSEELPSDLLSSLLRVETTHSTVSISKSAPVAIENLRTALEYQKVPRQLVEPAVACLLGFLNIR